MNLVTPVSEPRATFQDRAHVRLLALHHTVIGRSWDSVDVRDSYWRLYVNNRDGASLELPERRYVLVAHRVHFVPAWVRFTCRCTRPVGHLYLHFDVAGWTGALVREVFDAPATLPRWPRLERLAAELTRRLARGPADTADVFAGKALVYEALAQLIRLLPAEKAARFSAESDRQQPVAPALRYIDDHLAEPIPNPELARMCHLSTDHFIRVFRRCVGQTPAQYVLERRVALSAQRLLFTGDKIDQVAQGCGFANRFYFSRLFGRVMGVSPAAYRRSTRV